MAYGWAVHVLPSIDGSEKNQGQGSGSVDRERETKRRTYRASPSTFVPVVPPFPPDVPTSPIPNFPNLVQYGEERTGTGKGTTVTSGQSKNRKKWKRRACFDAVNSRNSAARASDVHIPLVIFFKRRSTPRSWPSAAATGGAPQVAAQQLRPPLGPNHHENDSEQVAEHEQSEG